MSIGIFSYLNTMTFGINADFDAFPDVDVLAGGIRRGVDELTELVGKSPEKGTAEKAPAKKTAKGSAAEESAAAQQ